jgi:tRNA threonylcarbamoyladenosine biosynthesis protein TsaE
VQIKVFDIRQLDEAAKKLIKFAGANRIWLFEGDLGAGKTTLIKAICRNFNVEDIVNSPSFSLVNEYKGKNGAIFYHLDFYRIKDEEEAMDIGAEEYIFSGNYCFIEWPSKIASLLPQQYVSVSIQVGPDGSRSLNLVKYV